VKTRDRAVCTRKIAIHALLAPQDHLDLRRANGAVALMKDGPEPHFR